MTVIDELVVFVRDRLNEDYETARLVLGVNAMADVINGKPAPRWVQPEGTSEIRDTKGIARVGHTWAREAEHITRWDPARVLAEVESKRRLLDWLVDCENRALDGNWWNLEVLDAVKALAQPFVGHPQFRKEWRIT